MDFLPELAGCELPWPRLRFFMLDERAVPLDHAESNYRMIHENFFARLLAQGLVKSSAIFPFDLKSASSPDEVLANYNETLQTHGGRLDICLMSIGEDGHLASLFPHHPELGNPTPAYIAINHAPKPPQQRISASLPLIQNCKAAFAFLVGAPKSKAYQRLQDPRLSLEDCPAKVLFEIPTAYLITDLPSSGESHGELK
jgi:6-phosphogluconolactonase